jgi:predicted nucleotidyltransferase
MILTITSCKEYTGIISGHKEMLCERFKISEIGTFGSHERGEQRPRSDVDILVEVDETQGLLEFKRLEDCLSEILNKKVDLVHKKALRPQLRDSILSEVQYV